MDVLRATGVDASGWDTPSGDWGGHALLLKKPRGLWISFRLPFSPPRGPLSHEEGRRGGELAL